jgi:hypothetical protein
MRGMGKGKVLTFVLMLGLVQGRLLLGLGLMLIQWIGRRLRVEWKLVFDFWRICDGVSLSVTKSGGEYAKQAENW